MPYHYIIVYNNYYYGVVLLIVYSKKKGLKRDNEDGFKLYEEYVNQRKIFIYNTVKVEDNIKHIA